MKRILVRIDDICPTMDFHQFQVAMELMDQYNVKPLLGVIPDCQDPDLLIDDSFDDYWHFIKELQNKGYTIAMHGYMHVFDNHARGIVVKRWDSEFAGHSYEIQMEKIRMGKQILESHGIYTDIFFAPGHSYDENTIKALAANGFKYMSDGLSLKPYEIHNIICIPARSPGMPRLSIGTNHTAVFHTHEWAFENKRYCYHQFVNLIEQHHNEILTWFEYINIPKGNLFLQRLFERSNVFFNRYIKSQISKILIIIRKYRSY